VRRQLPLELRRALLELDLRALRRERRRVHLPSGPGADVARGEPNSGADVAKSALG
jgi:hypothetical protein